MPHFQASRPRHGACYLDFVEVWLWQALGRDDDQSYRWARELAHWALAMHQELRDAN